MRRFGAVLSGGVLVLLGSCTPQSSFMGETECKSASAEVSYTWQATFYRDRNRANPDNARLVEYGSTKLVTVNGERPAGAVTGPDSNGVWFPKEPAPPQASQLDRDRQFGERVDPPELHRMVKHTLQCADGLLSTDGTVYRQTSQILRQGQPVRVRYSLGRVLQVLTPVPDAPVTQNPPTAPITVPTPSPQPPATTPPILYVNPATGRDRDTASQTQPLRTIARALTLAKSGTIIQLAPGVYSAESGETFPLQVPPGVTLRADPTAKGKGWQITGGGKYLSPTWAGQSVTIVATDRSRIEGLGITNPNTRGTAIWVEKGSPVIVNNRLIASDREGIFVSGQASPMIQDNVIEQNGGNGLSFTREATGVVRGNLIRNNGFGLAIGDRAAPVLISNEISGNKDGLVINGEARPRLQSNLLEANSRDGIVVTNNAQPVLQQNSFTGNGQYDLHNASQKPIKLDGLNVAGLKVTGQMN